jgi:hypothetical protein
LDLENPQLRLIPRLHDVQIERLTRRPCDQLFRRVPPVQSKGRIHLGLGQASSRREEHAKHTAQNHSGKPHHAYLLRHFTPRSKPRSGRPAFALVEITLALSMLTVIGLFMLKISLDILAPRQWALQQALSDAHMTYERAYAERLPFDNLLANDSPWPAFPNTASSAVEIGRLPGGTPVTGTIHRTRLPDAENHPVDGGNGDETNNPAAMKVWKVQSVLTYQIGGRSYAKSRTVIRSQ